MTTTPPRTTASIASAHRAQDDASTCLPKAYRETVMFTIHNDANACADDQRRYHRLVEAALPLAAGLSRLPLPEHITVRIATRDQFVTWQGEHNVLLAGKAIDSLDLGAVQSRMFKATAKAAAFKGRAVAARFAPMVQGAIIWRPDGPDLVVMPASHAESRGTDRFLTCVFAHEITHLVQLELNPALAYAPARCALQDQKARRATDDRRTPAAVTEGHAAWVQSRASELLCGVATRKHLPDEPAPTELFTQLTSEFPMARTYDRGEQLVAAAFTYGGHALIERLLKDEVLLPTNRELQEPEIWLNRHQDASGTALVS
ncbi:hypothetical protein AB0F92_34235 [Kitasatospora aureofaciens]|uniref:hypothetical protein n=1 Tax=Kitasatospora aureofaciens TaxID=1894 RepID=UPI003405F577